MDSELLFNLCGNAVMCGWLLLAFAPRWKWTVRLICSVILPSMIGVVYTYLIVMNLGKSEGGFSSLSEVELLFENKQVLLAGWIHYLAFDLFIGCWEVRDAQRVGIRHWFVIPCLILTLMLGPAGLLLYFLIRWSITRRILVGEESV